MSAYRLENPLRLLRELKGAPLAIFLALQIVRQRVTKSWLEQVTGYTDKPVAGALSYLTEMGYVDHTSSGWQLTGTFTQLPMPLQLEPENETRNDSESDRWQGRDDSGSDDWEGRNDTDSDSDGRNDSESDDWQDRNDSESDDWQDRNESDSDDPESRDWEKLLLMLEDQYRGNVWLRYLSAMQLARVERGQAVIYVPSQEQRDWLDSRCTAVLERAFDGFPNLSGLEAVFVVQEPDIGKQGRNFSDSNRQTQESVLRQNQIINSVCLTDSEDQADGGIFPEAPNTAVIRQILDAAEALFGEPIFGETVVYSDQEVLLSWIAQAYNSWKRRGGGVHHPTSLICWAFEKGKLPDKKYTRDHTRWLPDSFWQASKLWLKDND